MKFLLYLETQLLRNLQREAPRAHSSKGKRAGTPPDKARRELPAWLVWIWEHKDGQPHSLTRLQSSGSQAKGFPDSSISSNNTIPQVFLLERATDTDLMDESVWPSGMKPSDHQILLVLQSKQSNTRLTLLRGRKKLQWTEKSTSAEILKAIKAELHQAAKRARELRRVSRRQSQEKEESDLVHSFALLVGQQFQNSQCTIPHLAKILGISGARLQQICLKHHRMGPKAFLIQYRIQKSSELIRKIPEHRRCVMSKIAEASGFSSSSYFSFIFLNQMGMTPTEYRHQELHSSSPKR
ncbi:MAG: helix-turn-helix domain-containing protein [Bacteroidota bacterium]